VPTQPLRHTRVVALSLALLAAVAGLALPSRAYAATSAPSGLAPNSISVAGIPTLSWNRVSTATSYTLQVATSASFDNVFWQTGTVNRRVVPAANLPQTADGHIYWRVRASGPGGDSNWTTASFGRSPLAGPAPVSPADDAQLTQPTQPALLSWSPVHGATSYTVEIDTAPDFIGATNHTTQTTSLVVPSPDVATKYYWRVKGTLSSGSMTEYSDVRSYTLLGLEPAEVISPADGEGTKVDDVVLKWTVVPGAASYNLQVSTDINFPSTSETMTRNGITGTTFSPTTTFGNEQFYWRVQPVDTVGNTLDWDDVPVWQFQRAWSDQPSLEYPIDNALVGNPFYYQWTPVHLASFYRLELSKSPTFTTIYMSCLTRQTTYVPQTNGDCFPQSLDNLYWRVVAVDSGCSLACNEEVHTDRIVSQVERFTYVPSLVSLSSPANGATVSIPRLTWQPVPGASRYKVTVTNAGNGQVAASTDTAALAWVPRSLLTAGTYRWQVQTISESGRVGPSLLAGGQPTFNVTAWSPGTGSTPEPSGTPVPEGNRFPTLTWSEVTGATSYRVLVRPAGSVLWHYLDGSFAYPQGVFEGTTADGIQVLSPDDYEWMVEAYGGGVFISDSGTPGNYTITMLDDVVGQRAALIGSALDSDATSCLAALPARCVDLRQTPVLRWTPVPDAGFYKVYLSRDEEMTNIISTNTTEQNQWVSRDSLIDSQAGSAFYWFVQACKAGDNCSALQHAKHAFNKLSNKVELNSPINDASVADIVTFSWDDYLVTNSDPAPGHRDSTDVAPRQEAQRYEIQVSTVPNFQSQVDVQVVDQTTYTAFDKTYPEGPLYWRVRAYDGNGNPLAWSTSGAFPKSSASPAQQSPINSAVIGKTEPFRWAPMSYARSYDIQVYKNADTIGQSANLMLQGNSKQVAFSASTALPASATPYTWRVRRIDSGGREGPWTPLAEPKAKFIVTGAAPVLVSPTAGAKVIGYDSLFTWQAAAGAASYRWERRDPSSGSVVSATQTPALAWAATDAIPDGTWQWRVSSLDANGQVLGSSPWRNFVVDGTRPTVISFKPAAGAIVKPGVNFGATFSEPVTNVTTATVKLFKKGSSTPVAAKVALSANKRVMVLDPNRDLARGKVYTLRISSSVRDLSGLQLVATSWKVTVK